MATATKPTGIDPAVLDDLRAIMQHLQDKTPMDPELVRRAKERGDRVTERLRQEHVEIDIEKLLREVRDES
jgi:hypothetical protein